MGCELIDEQLVEFHFAGLRDPLRNQVEAHLGDCKRCLAEYLMLKRNEEIGKSLGVAPGGEVKARLLARLATRAPRGWWAAGAAAAAGVAAVVALALGLAREPHVGPSHASRVDTSRAVAVNLNVF